jgi:cell division protein FtsI/penicillin-binding protein 2
MHLEYKLKKVLFLYGFLLFFILVRVWFLSVINYEKMQKLSVLPRRKTFSVAPSRGLITDSGQVFLACNKKRFDIGICYQDIKQIPSFETYLENGKKIKFPKRKTYIQDLAALLEEHTQMTKEDIEDFIYAKAALFQDATVTLEENISEKSYHRLKLEEKDWPGLKIKISASRFYPNQKLACHVVGHVGPIDSLTYKKVSLERKILKDYIDEREKGLTPPLPKGFNSPFDVRQRYNELCLKNYDLQDVVGKEGIEKTYDEKLRGSCGKRKVEVTRLGQIVSELPGSYQKQKPSQVQLSIDLSLQEKAEMLLAERESNDDLFPKGGACVVLDLKTSQVLAIASYPRYNPQDFIDKKLDKIHKWSESDTYIRHLYQGLKNIEKEKFSTKEGFYESSQRLSYEYFLSRLISENSSCLEKLQKISSVKEAYLIVDGFEKLSEKFGYIDPLLLIKELENSENQDEETLCLYQPLKKAFKNLDDPILFLDILRLQIDPKKIQTSSLEYLDRLKLSEFFFLHQELNQINAKLEKQLLHPFEKVLFESWKKTEFKAFLKHKRAEEHKSKSYARPFTDYLIQEKKKQFNQFLNRYKKYICAYLFNKIPKLKNEIIFLEPYLEKIAKDPAVISWKKATINLSLQDTADFMGSFRPFSELSRPLLGSYRKLLEKKNHLEKHLALAFYPKYKLGYLRSNAYRFVAPQGSVFKVAVAYQALKEKFEGHGKKLPLIHDMLSPDSKNTKEQILGYDESKHPIRRWHKGGLLPRSSHSGIGLVDLVSALEQSSNIYFSLLGSDFIEDPLNLLEIAKRMGLGQKTGIDLPYEQKGKLPEDLKTNKTGLYAFAIGQHELLSTPLQTTLMISSLFNNGQVVKPQIVKYVHEEKKSSSDLFSCYESGAYSEALGHLGCYFPLFTEILDEDINTHTFSLKPVISSSYLVNKKILDPITKGLDKVVWGEKGTARPQAVAGLIGSSEMNQYMQLKHQMIGKTGTAEQKIFDTLDASSKARMLNHIWFAAISFSDESQKEPELAICVYLKDGKLGGKEAAPIAARLIQHFKQQKL